MEPTVKIDNPNTVLRVMISQPMNGKTDAEISATRERIEKILTHNGYEVVNSYFQTQWQDRDELANNKVVSIPVHFLAKAIDKMSTCHCVFFCDGWENARGCRIEHKIAEEYGLEIIHESNLSQIKEINFDK